jgi:hypothetical protein
MVIKDDGSLGTGKAITISTITTGLLFLIFYYINFSVVGEAIMPIFSFY